MLGCLFSISAITVLLFMDIYCFERNAKCFFVLYHVVMYPQLHTLFLSFSIYVSTVSLCFDKAVFDNHDSQGLVKREKA